MAYEKIEWFEIYPRRFRQTLKEKGESVRSISIACDIGERTLRRILNSSKPRMKGDTVREIAKFLDVSPHFLAGRYDVRARNESLPAEERELWFSLLTADKFPYEEDIRASSGKEYLRELLSFHSISDEQFRALPYEMRLGLLIKIEEGLAATLAEYFPVNARGEDTYLACQQAIINLEGRRENYLIEGDEGEALI